MNKLTLNLLLMSQLTVHASAVGPWASASAAFKGLKQLPSFTAAERAAFTSIGMPRLALTGAAGLGLLAVAKRVHDQTVSVDEDATTTKPEGCFLTYWKARYRPYHRRHEIFRKTVSSFASDDAIMDPLPEDDEWNRIHQCAQKLAAGIPLQEAEIPTTVKQAQNLNFKAVLPDHVQRLAYAASRIMGVEPPLCIETNKEYNFAISSQHLIGLMPSNVQSLLTINDLQKLLAAGYNLEDLLGNQHWALAILFHELTHIRCKHSGYDQLKINNLCDELEADLWGHAVRCFLIPSKQWQAWRTVLKGTDMNHETYKTHPYANEYTRFTKEIAERLFYNPTAQQLKVQIAEGGIESDPNLLPAMRAVIEQEVARLLEKFKAYYESTPEERRIELELEYRKEHGYPVTTSMQQV